MDKTDKGLIMRRSDIYSIITLVFVIGAVILGWGYRAKQIEINTIGILDNKVGIDENNRLASCVDANAHWIERNRNLSDKVLTSELKVEFLQDSIDRLSVQIEIATKNFAQLNQRLANGLIQ